MPAKDIALGAIRSGVFKSTAGGFLAATAFRLSTGVRNPLLLGVVFTIGAVAMIGQTPGEKS